MRSDGLRVTLLSAVGIPAFVGGTIALLESRGSAHLVFALVFAGGGAALVLAAIRGWPVGPVGWLATGGLGLAAFASTLSLWSAEPLWPVAALHGIFWWLLAVLLVVPAAQATRALQRARQLADRARDDLGRDVRS